MSGKKVSAPKIVRQFKETRSVINLRKVKRIDLRRSDGVHAKLFVAGLNPIHGEVYDLTTFGASLVISRSEAQKIGPLKEVFVEFVCNWGPSFGRHFTICWFENYKTDLSRVGLRAEETPEHKVTRRDTMVDIPTRYPLVGYIYKDFFYYEKSIVKLISIDRNHAIVEVLDDETIFFEGQRVQILFALHTTSLDQLFGKISKAEVSKDKKLTLEIADLEISKKLELELINHLVQNTDLSLEKIREAGFRIKHISNNFRFRWVKTHEEYLAVLDLRFIAYSSSGKVAEGASREDMAAPLDHISRILTCYHGEKLIASVALAFPESEDLVLDTERPLPKGYPKEFPKKSQLIEISRLCTHPDYRRGDVLLRAFEHIYKVYATSDREYLLTSTDEKLWPLYKGMGFKKTAHSYEHLQLNGIKHYILIGHKSVPVRARNISILRWNYLYRDMTNFMLERKVLAPGPFLRIKLFVWSKIGWLMGLGSKKRY